MIELLRNRRSIRKFTDKSVEAEKLELLKEAILRAPSSKNINPWEFIFIDSRDIIQKLKQCKPHGTIPLETAPLAVVICADETRNDVWIEDCSIASMLLQLTAQSLGLGSCWIQVRNRSFTPSVSSEDYIQQLLGIPRNFRVLNIVAAGYPQILRKGKPVSELQYEKIKTNRFQQG